MEGISLDVDVALTEVPVNAFPLTDDTDFKSREIAVAYNAAGMDLVWNFLTSAGAFTQTAVTPTTAGDYDWTHQGDGMYTIEIPASGGASINNDTEGYGWFTGVATGVLPWRSPVYCFRAAALNDALCDGGDVLDVNLTQYFGFTPESGTAQSATANTLVLASATSLGDDIVNGDIFLVHDSTNGLQANIAEDYTGATDTVTFSKNFNATPTGTITYARIPQGFNVITNSNPLAADVRQVNGSTTGVSTLIADIASILADTGELQTDDVPGLIAALNDLSAAQVATEIGDALATDTRSLPSAGAPTASPTIAAAIMYLYAWLRNKKTVNEDTGKVQVYADDGTTILYEMPYADASNVLTVSETQANV